MNGAAAVLVKLDEQCAHEFKVAVADDRYCDGFKQGGVAMCVQYREFYVPHEAVLYIMLSCFSDFLVWLGVVTFGKASV